jgi:cell division protein FtsX
MSIVLTVLAVLVTFSILSALVLLMFSLPTIVKGWRQRREDEFYMAERLTAEVKATRHRDLR